MVDIILEAQQIYVSEVYPDHMFHFDVSHSFSINNILIHILVF